MKDFKLKTLAAVCLFTVSAYGMEEAPDNSQKSSESFLYCVDDEDIDQEQKKDEFVSEEAARIGTMVVEQMNDVLDVYEKFNYHQMKMLVAGLSYAPLYKIIVDAKDCEGDMEQISRFVNDVLHELNKGCLAEMNKP